jgi:Fe-S cluster assembly protein SufD
MTGRTTREALLDAFHGLERENGALGPSWLRAERREAIARFAERGLPTTRDEEWRYTSLAPLAGTALDLAGVQTAGDVAPDTITPYLVGPPSWSRLVFVNGRYAARLSSLSPLPAGAWIGSLSEALTADPERARVWIDAAAQAGVPDALATLNQAFWRDGACLHVPAGVSVPEPVHVMFVTTASNPGPVQHPRSLVVLEPGSRAAVLESHITCGVGTSWTNQTTAVALGTGAVLDHYQVELDGPRAFHSARTDVRQDRESRFTSWSICFGGRLVRSDVRVSLGGEQASCALSGLSVIGGQQHVDTRTDVAHIAPRATSRQRFKAILDGRARGVFNGRVVVQRGADGTDAHQSTKNLLLSDHVEVDSKPQLEIFADDVKCSHGAADGQLGSDAVFYLKSRGLDEDTARALLAFGFANEVLGTIQVEPIRAWLESALTARLRGGRVAQEDTV